MYASLINSTKFCFLLLKTFYEDLYVCKFLWCIVYTAYKLYKRHSHTINRDLRARVRSTLGNEHKSTYGVNMKKKMQSVLGTMPSRCM